MEQSTVPQGITLFYDFKQKHQLSWREYLLLEYIQERQLDDGPGQRIRLSEMATFLECTTSYAAQLLNKLLTRGLVTMLPGGSWVPGQAYMAEMYR